MKTNIKIDFSKITGEIKPLHGVNNGPLTNNFTCDASDYFRQAGIPYCRLHDTEYPLGGNGFVDIHCVFPDFDADPADPASYNFANTDRYIQAIVDAGAKVVYRLGSSIEHQPVKLYIFPPPDFEKWAEICCGIIRHYNRGWAGGFYHNIEYWEIWNEPENDIDSTNPMWQGTKEQFYSLYEITAKRIKREFPDLKVGGYASCGAYAIEMQSPPPRFQYFLDFFREFLGVIKSNGAPLDFFSWHIYSPDPAQYARHQNYFESVLAERGFADTEIILDEWNWSGENMFEVMKTAKGAAHVAAVFCALQKTSLAKAMYYDGQPKMQYCGLFGGVDDLTPRKPLWALKAWDTLYRLGSEVLCEVSGGANIYAAAAADKKGEKGEALLIVNYGGDAAEITISASDTVKTGKAELRLLDAENDLAPAGGLDLTKPASLTLGSDTAALLIL